MGALRQRKEQNNRDRPPKNGGVCLSGSAQTHATIFWGMKSGSLPGILHAGPDAFAQHGNLVERLPGQLDIGAPEVAEGGGGLIDRAAQVQRLDNPGGAQIEVLVDQANNLRVRNLTRAKGIDKERERARHADRDRKSTRLNSSHV